MTGSYTDATPSRPYLKATANIPVSGFPLSAASDRLSTRSSPLRSHRLSPLLRMCSQPLTANRYYLSRAVSAREQGARGGGRTRTPCGART